MNFTTTRRVEYGLTAAMYLARPQDNELTQVHEIAQHCNLPEPFLGQILRRLVQGGLVRSKKGVGGGFCLARSPEEISFLEVVEILEGPVAVNRCQRALDACQRKGRCSMEFVWARAQSVLVGALRDITLAEASCPGHFPDVPATLAGDASIPRDTSH